MSSSITCDNCDNTEIADNAEALLPWVKVGWHQAGVDDACSIGCARQLLDQMEQAERDLEADHQDT